MNVKKKFKEIFILLGIENSKQNKILMQLQILYDNQIISTELLFNLIKGMVYILYKNINSIDNYLYIFDKLLEVIHKKKIKQIFKSINNNNFSKQFEISEKIIEDIITQTDIFINKVINTKIILLLDILNNIISEITKLNIDIDNKINIYIFIMKYYNREFYNNNFDYNDIIIIINLIKKLIL
jgi:hypothetical protein